MTPILPFPPDFSGGGIVNLMGSILMASGASPNPPYPPASILPPERLAAARHIILILVDGLGADFLTQLVPDSRMEALRIGTLTSVFPPTTATAIPVFYTGYPPQQHGLTGWFTYVRELGSLIAVLPFRPRCGGGSLGQYGVNPLQLTRAAPIFPRLKRRPFVLSPEKIAHSDFNRAFCLGAEILSYQGLEGFFRSLRLLLNRVREPSFVYAYWPDLDLLAHASGISSPKTLESFRLLDAAFADFLIDIHGSGTAVILTADHGFLDTGPERMLHLNDHPDLREHLRLPLSGESRTVYCHLRPGHEQGFLATIEDRLAPYLVAVPSQELLEQGCFGLGTPHPELPERIGDYTLLLRENYTFKDWLPGESPYVHLGVHGGTSREEMLVPLILAEV